MANYDFTNKANDYAALNALVTQEDNRFVVMRNVVDFAEQNLTGGADTAYVMDIPANTLVVAAGLLVLTADASAQLDLGDTSTATQFLTNSDVSTAGTVDFTTDLSGAIYYSAADHLVVTCDATMDTSKIEFFMVCLPVNIDNKVKKPMAN